MAGWQDGRMAGWAWQHELSQEDQELDSSVELIGHKRSKQRGLVENNKKNIYYYLSPCRS